ncbi:uncharacterized protein NPIL_316452 [Nephila pilipes]|uniref:Uncharacterized protein n=1 Tax=Nephila pilipes TaxID=299642 RepID=A0A8X6QIF7_NEPPI|nr:uncharacterized protein NPIL_316452 [Nephila pilipes]
MKNKKAIVTFQDTEDDVTENEFTVTKRPDPKTFAKFVDKVIDQIPLPMSVKKKSKSLSMCKFEESNDPLKILRNRGLLSIDNPQKDLETNSSEVDLTFYTEENRLGEVVKIFSSTHRFRNGRLVYSTTQEASPNLSKEIGKFNDWWNLQGPGRSKNIEDDVRIKGIKSDQKKLSDIFKELQRQEVIKRYESASRKSMPIYYRKSPRRQVKTDGYGRKLKPHEEICKPKSETSRNQHQTHIHYIPQDEQALRSQSLRYYPTSNRREDDEEEDIVSQEGKVKFRAVWRHKSPSKTHRNGTTDFKESRKGCMKSSQKELQKETQSQQKLGSQQTFKQKVSPFMLASRMHHSNIRINTPMRFRPVRKVSSASDRRSRSSPPENGRRLRRSFSIHRDKMVGQQQHDGRFRYRTNVIKKHQPDSTSLDEDTSSEDCRRRKQLLMRYQSEENFGPALANGDINQSEGKS